MYDHHYFIRKSWGKYSPSAPAHLTMSFQDWKRASLVIFSEFSLSVQDEKANQNNGEQGDPKYALLKPRQVDETAREKRDKFSASLTEVFFHTFLNELDRRTQESR